MTKIVNSMYDIEPGTGARSSWEKSAMALESTLVSMRAGVQQASLKLRYARELEMHGLLAEAHALLTQAVETSPLDARFHTALAMYKAHVLLDPHRAQEHFQISVSMSLLGFGNYSKIDGDKVLSTRGDTLAHYAAFLLESGTYDRQYEALRSIRRAVALNPSRAAAWLTLGRIRVRIADSNPFGPPTMAAFQQAVSLEPLSLSDRWRFEKHQLDVYRKQIKRRYALDPDQIVNNVRKSMANKRGATDMSSRLHHQTKNADVALCFFGQLRQLERTALAWQLRVIKVLHADVFAAVSNASRFKSLRQFFPSLVQESFESDPSPAQLEEILRSSPAWSAYVQDYEIWRNRIFDRVSYAPIFGIGANLYQMFYQQRCLEQIVAHETLRGSSYRYIASSRTDILWLAHHPPVSLLDAQHCWVPVDQHQFLIGVVDDRYGICGRSLGLTYLSRWRGLLTGSALEAMQLSWSEEDSLFHWLRLNKIAIARFPQLFILTCCDGTEVTRSSNCCIRDSGIGRQPGKACRPNARVRYERCVRGIWFTHNHRRTLRIARMLRTKEYHLVRHQHPVGIRLQRRPLMLEGTLASVMAASAPRGGATINCTDKETKLNVPHTMIPARELPHWPGSWEFSCHEIQLLWCTRFAPEHSSYMHDLCPETCGRCAPLLAGESPFALVGADKLDNRLQLFLNQFSHPWVSQDLEAQSLAS